MRLILTIIGFGFLLIDGADKRKRIESLESQVEEMQKAIAFQAGFAHEHDSV